MLDTPQQMVRTTLGTTSATLGTVPTGTAWIVRNVVLANNTATAATATLTFAGSTIVPGVSVPANGVVTFDFAQVLPAGSVIAGLSGTASSVICHIAGIQVAY